MQDAARRKIFEDWTQAHRGLIAKVLRAYAFHAHDREDLLQEIAVQLWDSIPRYREESAVSTWIYRVALYAGIAWSRRERKHREGARSADPEGASMAADIPAPESEEDPRLAWLYAQLASLDPVDRSLLLLLLEGLSYREIAAAMGISEKNVSVKLHRIKRSLAERSQQQGEQHGL